MTRWLGVFAGAAIVVAGMTAAQGQILRDRWEIPHPDKVEHPGVEQAPASSPRTYPDAAGFEARAYTVLQGVADNDLMSWRRGYFSGGDPGKYLPGHAMAKLLIGQEDPNIRRLYNDNRSPGEHYHFAAHNWARFLPIFGAEILTDATRQELASRAAGYTAYHSGGGTENHVTQWRTAALVVPHYLEGSGQLGRQSRDAVVNNMKGWLRNFVRGVYHGGNGEWDSSTYIMFTMNGLQSIYDFSPDEETRLIARAGLDWFATAYALKYRDGVYTSPNQRGFAPAPHRTIADETGYIWWGSNAEITPQQTRGWRYTIHPITSGWRPNAVITHIARKDLPDLPAEFRNSKPNYWGTTGSPRPSQMHESVYLGRHYTMASLWNGAGGQITRFQIVAESDNGGIVLTGGTPTHFDHNARRTGRLSFRDGGGNFDQTAQVGSMYVSLSRIPEAEEHQYSFFSVPEGAQLAQQGPWRLMQVGKAYVAVFPLSENVRVEEVENAHTPRILRMDGRNTGFIVETADVSEFPSLQAFGAAVNEAVRVDTGSWESDGRITARNRQGQSVQMRFRPHDSGRGAAQTAEVSIDGQAVEFGNWPVYSGRYVQQANGIMRVTDGRNGYIVDFTGDLPVYRAWDGN